MSQVRAKLDIVRVDHREHRVWIIDKGGRTSITEDAVAVVRQMHTQLPHYRVFYRDTGGEWDELLHDDGVFNRWVPARAMATREGMV